MSILKDLDRIAKDVEKGLANIGDDIEKDLATATQVVQKGLDEGKQFLQKGFDEAEAALMKSKIAEVKDKYKGGITLLHNVWANSLKNADTESISNDVKTVFTAGATDAGAAASALESLVTSQTVQASYKDLEKWFDTVSAGAVGELNLVVGTAVSGGVGVIVTHGDDLSPRLLADFAVSGGAEEGIEGGAFLAFWKHSPQDLQGGFLAVSVEGVLEAGVGLIFYFDVSLDPDFIGAAVAVSAGEEAELSVELGFTLAFKLPRE